MFILMISFAILIWIASGDNSADPSLLAEVLCYKHTFAIHKCSWSSYKLSLLVYCVGVCRYFCFNNPNHWRRTMLLW